MRGDVESGMRGDTESTMRGDAKSSLTGVALGVPAATTSLRVSW